MLLLHIFVKQNTTGCKFTQSIRSKSNKNIPK